MKVLILSVFLFVLAACEKRESIIDLLNSDSFNDRLEGIYQAGESGDQKYIPLILRNRDDNDRASTAFRFKGFTVYTEKMFALERLFKIKPPHTYGGILRLSDSVNINFYKNLWQEKKTFSTR